jgi:Holliday junction resolvasome RuvABC ATP-dependent DNA helicase subunit
MLYPEEEMSGPYHDFSLVIFPNDKGLPWLICLGIGSSGFKNDYELATYPGLRRLFSKLIDNRGYYKPDFSDIETSLPKNFTETNDLLHIKNTIKKYTKVLPACQIIEDPESENGKKIISAFVAAYAKLREWPSNEGQRKAISESLKPFLKTEEVNDIEEVKKLLEDRRYVVLQGPPGSGKTRLTKKIADNLQAKTFFIQFHAETSYSDFIYGIRPDIQSKELNYIQSLGKFTESLKYALENENEKVVLIIDEINRANLSNVLGPIFYLFEYKMDKSEFDIEIFPGFKINQLPINFLVIASMNTADRSLAVVDFALRRRFAWYTVKPKVINAKDFFEADFLRIQEIFNWYANTNELSLQPGQGYFIADSDSKMKDRIKYEILPLIKEYLLEGLIRNAKEEFNEYFLSRIGQSLFE